MHVRDDLTRAPILVRHDVNTLGWLFDCDSDPHVAHVICTWDKLHPYVQKHEEAEWDVLDPVAFGDVLSLAAPESEDVTIVSPLVVALMLSADAEKKGAAVWDKLVLIESEKLQDAPLRKAARAFKLDRVAKAANERRSRSLQDAWQAWKETHLALSSKPDTDAIRRLK